MDFAAAGLLEGLEGEEREARQQLLERLAAAGCSLEELRAAVAENRLALIPVERVLGGRYTVSEIEERAGLSKELLMRIRRLLGLPVAGPDDRVFGEEEVAAAQSIKMFIDAGIGEEAIAEITRVLGEGMSRVASTTVAAFAETFLNAGDSEHDVAWRFASLAEQLVPAFSPVLLSAYRAHLREAVQRGMITRAELATGHLEGEELGSVVAKFVELAADVAGPEVRLVKTIGDAAMFTARQPEPLVQAALRLLEAAERADLPSLRVGIAYGRALPRAGDFYGHTVNLASRVTGIARPGSVLCTQEVRDAAPERFDWSHAGKHRLKGVGDSIPLYRARPLRDEPQGGDDGSGPRKPRAGRRRRRASR